MPIQNPGPMPLRIFLSSPGDVAAEREKARQVVEHLQFDPFVRGRVAFDIVSWDDPRGTAPLMATETPQESISRGLPRPSECDVVVVILWSRMGTPLPFPRYQKSDGSAYLSGTEWEYEDAVAASRSGNRPVVLVYRCTTKVAIDPVDPRAEALLQQSRLVAAFFDKLRDPVTGAIRGGHKRYASPEEFRRVLDFDLRSLTHQLLAASEPRDIGTDAELPPFWEGSPFPGLRAFTPRDEPIFFGRGRETDELVTRVLASDFVAVVGASGSGKSSLVGAGLLPRLAVERPAWRLPTYSVEGRRWTRLRCTPAERGDDPFPALTAQLGASPTWAERLRARPEEVKQLLPDGTSVLFVDQFEELFANVHPQWTDGVIELLVAAVQSQRCRLVLTLRADFYHRCLEIPSLARLLESGQLPLSAPTETRLEMITRPAERAGLAFEEGLPGRILHDTGPDPDALPLLAYTLDELYHANTGNDVLTHATYEGLGGVHGAIGTRADIVFSRLDDATRETFQPVFRGLVRIDEAGRATRRRAPLADMATDPAALRLVTAFTEARLLTQSRDESNQPVVFAAHEALFSHWPRLAQWIAGAREDLMLQNRVAAAAAEWAAHGRDDAYLWPHERLVDVAHMIERSGFEPDPVTSAFVQPEFNRIFPLFREPGIEQHRLQYAIDRLVTIGPATIPGLLELLAEGSPTTQNAAGATLARLGEPAVNGLVKALGAADADVRLVAVSSLRLIGTPSVINGLARAVSDVDPRVRSAAIGALAAIGGPESRELIADALRDSHLDLRWQAAGALGAFGPEAVPHLLSLEDTDEISAETAKRALLAIGERGIPELLDGLRSDDAGVRLRAGQALVAIGAPAVPGVVEALTDSRAGVRWSGCEVLASSPVPPELEAQVCRALTSALSDPEPGVRSAAVHALGQHADAQGTAALIGSLEDGDEAVRWAAVDALAAAGPSVGDALIDTMLRSSPAAALASAALLEVGGADTLIPHLGSHGGWVGERIEEALARADELDVGRLVDLLADKDPEVRQASARTLAQVGPAAASALVATLDDDRAVVRAAAAWSLGIIAANASGEAALLRPAFEALEALLNDPDPHCRALAADSLGRFGDEALPALWRSLRSSRAEHRDAARLLCARLGPAAVQGLLVLAREDASAAQLEAVGCLRTISTPAAVFGLTELVDPRGTA